MDKHSARLYGLAARASLTPEQRCIKSAEVTKKLLPLLENAEVIGCYVSMRDELDTSAILDYCFQHAKVLAVPVTAGNTLTFREIHSRKDLRKGRFGVMEPYTGREIDPSLMDLMIVPLSCFDEAGHRTGYGKGYYDSILSVCRCRIGIAFAEQKTEGIETDPWDIDLDQVIYA